MAATLLQLDQSVSHGGFGPPAKPTSLNPTNRSKTLPAARQPLPIHWLKSSAFNIPIPRDETQRLAALDRYDILDTPPERTFDDIAVLAAHVCATPIALLVLIDRNRQWFKAKVGVRLKETPRAFAFCAHTIMQRRLSVVSDLSRDRRFAANPFVVSGPLYRFYAGAPLVTPDNRALGTLCVIDRFVRTLTRAQKKDLQGMSRLVMTELELRRILRDERQIRTPRHRRRG